MALVGGAEASGRPTTDNKRHRKRIQWVLGQATSGGNKGELGLTKESLKKQRAGGDIPRKRLQDIMSYFEEKGRDNSLPLGRTMEERKGGRTQSGPPLEAGPKVEVRRTEI